MLKKQRQQNYIDKRWAAIKEHLHRFSQTQNLEELHRLRVEIKKIYAFALLLGNKNKYLVSLEPVKKLFKHAGSIRDLQISLQLAYPYVSVNSSEIRKQQEKLYKESQKFSRATKKYQQKISASHEKFRKKIFPVEEKYIQHLFDKTLKKLDRTFAKRDPEDQLHNSRKKLKQLRYIHDLLGISIKRDLKLNLGYLHELEEYIGKWHDEIISAEILKAFCVEQKDSLSKIDSNRERSYRRIISSTKNFAQKARLES